MVSQTPGKYPYYNIRRVEAGKRMLGAEMERGTKSLGNFLGLAGAVLPRAGKVFSEMSFRILPRRCFEGLDIVFQFEASGAT